MIHLTVLLCTLVSAEHRGSNWHTTSENQTSPFRTITTCIALSSRWTVWRISHFLLDFLDVFRGSGGVRSLLLYFYAHRTILRPSCSWLCLGWCSCQEFSSSCSALCSLNFWWVEMTLSPFSMYQNSSFSLIPYVSHMEYSWEWYGLVSVFLKVFISATKYKSNQILHKMN